MLSTDKAEFQQGLRMLFAALDKPLGETKEDAFWKALEKMSIIDFGRACNLLLEELQDGDKAKEWRTRFTVGDMWAAKRRLRSGRAPQQQPAEPPWKGDYWDERANKWLLSYILTQASQGIHYCSQRDRNVLHRGPNWLANDETHALTQPLADYKKAWAADMRELEAESGIPDIDYQRSTFRECLRRADEQINSIRPRFASGAAAV